MKISTLVVLSFFTVMVGLAPIASAARIDFEKFDKYNADTDNEKKTKTDKSSYSKNSEPGALKSEDKKGWLGTYKSENVTYVQNSVQGVPVPSTLLLFGVGFVALAMWYQRSRRGIAA